MDPNIVVKPVIESYGPYAFGVVLLAIVVGGFVVTFKQIVKPLLARDDQEAAIRRKHELAIAETLRESAVISKDVSETMKQIASQVAQLVQDVERLTERVERLETNSVRRN